MSHYRNRISSLALHQMDRASAWWRKNRHKAPTAFDDDTDDAIRRIRLNPSIGQPVLLRKPARRLWMERIRFFLYYREKGDIVEISRCGMAPGAHRHACNVVATVINRGTINS